ncbi:MAG: hypothetical protein ACD_46C00181G0035 [uncultured bacterium]|nr:MAG: hypothetical protein ACD_46C00181G0035 [uncultured bacterium]
MDNERRKISQFTLMLQSQTQLPLWSLANEKVIYSIAVGETPIWGPKTRILRHIMAIAYKFYLSDFLIFIIGSIQSFFIWWNVKKNTFSKQNKMAFKRVFAGFGASSEEYLYEKYVNQSQDLTLRINWTKHKGLSELGCPSFLSILFMLTKNSFGYTSKLKQAQQEISANRLEFLTVCALNIANYAFYNSYWRIAKQQGIQEAAFVTPDILSVACIDVGINSIYFQHGLLALSILIPKFKRIDVLTQEEENYLKNSLKDVQINKMIHVINTKNTKNKVLLVLSINVFQQERLLACESLFQWAKEKGLQIVIRPTSRATKDDLKTLSTNIPEALIDDVTVPLEESLKKWNPKIVAAWTSTGLVTALEHEYLPISLFDPSVKEVWCNMIYPLKDRVLFWPRDRLLIESSMQSEENYAAQIFNLLQYQNLILESC